MEENKIIISMTSWPKRIKFVAKAMYTLLQQNVDKSLYHIVLVLCDKEFPNKENEFPADLKIMYESGYFEIIWYDRNILSHKKLMPTLMKYPNNPILVCDEDILRPVDWLSHFINCHKKYPNDVLVGGCLFDVCFEPNGRFNPIKKHYFDKPEFAEKIIKNRRPANGFGGVLYPVGTFKDFRFYDIDLLMKLSAYSDESWQYCFNIMEGKTLRWISKIINYDKLIQQESFKTAMCVMRDKLKTIPSYPEIYNTLINYFPEFKEKLIEKLK